MSWSGTWSGSRRCLQSGAVPAPLCLILHSLRLRPLYFALRWYLHHPRHKAAFWVLPTLLTGPAPVPVGADILHPLCIGFHLRKRIGIASSLYQSHLCQGLQVQAAQVSGPAEAQTLCQLLWGLSSEHL